MAITIRRRLASKRVLVLDGGLGTELESRGIDVNHTLWSTLALVKNPNKVYEVHRDYIEAGADIITTCTYQASIKGLLETGEASSVEEAGKLISSAVDLAKQARDAGSKHNPSLNVALVAASIGPYGAYLGNGSEYSGTYGPGVDKEELASFHISRLKALLRGEPDLLALETIPRVDELEVLLDLILDICPHMPFWISLSVRDEGFLADGTELSEVINCVESRSPRLSIIAIGVNCCPLESTSAILGSLRDSLKTKVSMIAYPNSGESYDASRKEWRGKADSNTLDSLALQWIDIGARIIGGCCRTRPSDIRKLSAVLHSADQNEV